MATEIKLKICGMRDSENIMDVARLNPDYMGFIFYPMSKRYVGNDFVIPAGLSPSIKKVGVFVNASTWDILNIVSRHRLDAIQLHGNETGAQCAELRSAGLVVIKAFGVHDNFEFSVVSSYLSAIDFALFDTKGEGLGGSGRAFDWKLLAAYRSDVPFFLSGGLTPENVKDIPSSQKDLFAVDANSGVEIEPGIKDVVKIQMMKDNLSAI